MTTWSIVLAAGSGSRFGGDEPKQYLELHGRRVIDWSIEVARSSTDGVVLVVPPDRAADREPSVDVVVAGGSTRSESVRAGLAVLPGDCQIVAVHDGARPLATAALFEAVIGAVRAGADGAVPGLAVTDTIKRVVASTVVETLDRAELVAVQTPQAFRVETLRTAHGASADATDDAALIEASGGTIVVVPGEATNTKLTHARDLPALEVLVARRAG